MKIRIVMSALLLTANFVCHAQAVPTAESPLMSSSLGPNLPSLDGVVHYALSASEIVQYGYYGPGDVSHSTDLTRRYRLHLEEHGAALRPALCRWCHPGEPVRAGNVVLLESIRLAGIHHAALGVQYLRFVQLLPQSPTTGLSGIAGVGDLGAPR